MAQIGFGYCLDQFAPRPDLQPDFYGSFVPRNEPRCLGLLEEKRRKDVKPAQFGNGIPAIGSFSQKVPLRERKSSCSRVLSRVRSDAAAYSAVVTALPGRGRP